MVTFGSDWSVAPLNPLPGVHAAVTRRTLDGRNPNGWIPEEKVSVQEALICCTRNNAYAVFQEDFPGTLEAGKPADVVVLSASPFEVAPEEIGGIQVMEMIAGGRGVFQWKREP